MRAFPWRAIAAALSVVLLFPACGDDATTPEDTNTSPYKNLSQRGHVPQNLEVSLNRRNLGEFKRLLAHDFTFYFADDDVSHGRAPERWQRATEINAVTNMFNPNYTGNSQVQSIDVSLDMENVVWGELTQNGNTVYQADVPYSYTIEAEPDLTWTSTGSRIATFTVRSVDIAGVQEWRLVEWRDIEVTRAVATSPASEEQSLGRIKVFFRDKQAAKDDVLHAMVLAHKYRSIADYDDVVDEEFIFYFAPEDIGETPREWDHSDEMDAMANIFDPLYPNNTVQSSELALDLDDVNWIDVIPDLAPDEIWCMAAIPYFFVVEALPDITFVAQGRAEFMVRPAGPRWRLAESRDLGTVTVRAPVSANAVATTWGKIKHLYYEDEN